MKKLKLKNLLVLILLSNVLFAQTDDRFYKTTDNKSTDNSKKNTIQTTKKDTSKTKQATEVTLALGLTKIGSGTARYNLRSFAESFATEPDGAGIYLHFGALIPIKNNFYFSIKQQIQTEKSKSSEIILNETVNFNTISILTNLGIEKRFGGFYIGADLGFGLAVVTNNKSDIIPGTDNNFSTKIVAINGGLGYQFKNGVRLGVSQRFSGETKYEYSYESFPFSNTYWFESSNATYNANLTTIFIGYSIKLKDTKKKTPSTNNKISDNNPSTPNYNLVPIDANTPFKENITAKTNYSKYSDEELKTLLDQATVAEKYSKANEIQTEITKRTNQNKYAKTSDEDLKKLLDEAIKKEDYTTAQIIQLEIDKRVALKKDAKGKTDQTNTPTKKTLKELEVDLKKAMDAEDYKKADEIQKEINKLK